MSKHPNQVPASEQSLRRKSLHLLLLIAVCFLALYRGWYAMNTVYRVYDDEGYMLLSMSHYLAGGHLYTEVFSQYGPFNFYAQEAFYRLLHLSVNHDHGRLVALIFWALSAGLGGGFVYRVSRNIVLASAAVLAVTQTGLVLSNEPGHPQEVILAMFMLACFISVNPGRKSFLLLGAIGAALCFTKLNVGVFYLAATAFALTCRLRSGRSQKLAVVALLAYAVLGPLLLMHHDVPGWARNFAIVAVLCGVSVFLAGFLLAPSSPESRAGVFAVILGAASATALIVLGVTLQGMSIATLLDGVLWLPLKHPSVFHVPLLFSKKSMFVVFMGSACMAAGLYRFRNGVPANAAWFHAARCLAGVLVIGYPPASLMLISLLPLSLIPWEKEEWKAADYFPRLFVTGLAAMQLLQMYPVAGSQISISTSPVVLWAFLCVYDGAGGLVRVARKIGWAASLLRSEQIVSGFLLLVLGFSVARHSNWYRGYPEPASRLRGSASLHLPVDSERLYEELADDVHANCDVLFTMPGMGSLNFWSGVPTPNGLNLTAWMKILSLSQQGQILDILQKDPRACAVYNQEVAANWQSIGDTMGDLPLGHYVLYDMPTVWRKHGYEIHVSPMRSAPWIPVKESSTSVPPGR